MSETPGSASGGLLAATRNGAATLLAIGRTRLELLGNDLKEEKLRAVRVLLLSQVVAFSLMVGTILAITLLVVVFWENRVLLLSAFTVISLASGGFAYAALRRSLRTRHQPFAASVAELAEDLRQMKGSASHEPRAD
ncbi:MAG: phage holin family protein [Accumulibacter sp.]|jgi:uncharacterized membrane protein YqjE|uniref:phage holin family protein n=1 Tax=Accumulibacter sp. TaxID=2053492 RepID=UPI002FC3A1ED